MTDSRKLDPTILREYDIRGIVGDTLDADDVRVIGRTFGSIVGETAGRDGNPVVAVGYDGRISSPELCAALTEGLTAAGADVRLIGRGPTPMLYFATYHLDVDAGMMITGSHNPPDHNGIKMVLGHKPFHGADIQALGVRAGTGRFSSGSGEVEEVEVEDAYVDQLVQGFSLGVPLRVAWDAGNGAAGDVLKKLLRRLPHSHYAINTEIDGTFPAHHPDPTVEENLEQLKELVTREHCDLGFAFDGDGDRIGLVDSEGRALWGDQIMVVLARDVLSRNPGATIIADVKASQVLFDEIERAGGKPVMWKAGHSLIKTKMAETGSPLAGEMSGHIFIADGHYGYDDALYAAVRVMSVLAAANQRLADVRDSLPQMVNTPELRFECADNRKFDVIDEVKARLKGRRGITVRDIDGVRVETSDGWWLLRASNTQAVLVARCEAADSQALARLKSAVAEQLEASGIEPPNGFI